MFRSPPTSWNCLQPVCWAVVINNMSRVTNAGSQERMMTSYRITIRHHALLLITAILRKIHGSDKV